MSGRNGTWAGRFEKQDCPHCGHECYRDEADVGVGMIYGPWGCPCGWSEDERYDTRGGAKQHESGYTPDQYGGLTPPGGYGSAPGPLTKAEELVDPQTGVLKGWRLWSADFSVQSEQPVPRDSGCVMLVRDPEQKALWYKLPEYERENPNGPDLYVTGRGMTFAKALANANRAAACYKPIKRGGIDGA